jgi:hypothetical protein
MYFVRVKSDQLYTWSDEYQRTAHRRIAKQKAKVLALARDLPLLWHAPTTQAKDRKRMLRLLIQDITVDKGANQKLLTAHIRWRGGACSDLPVQLPANIADRLRYLAAVVDRVRDLAQSALDADIAQEFNREGRSSATGKPYTAKMIQWIRRCHGIPPAVLRKPEELTVQQVARHFGISDGVVYYWIELKLISARRVNAGMPYWITLDKANEQKLRTWVRHSTKIQNGKSFRNAAVAGAL